jgi:hypothetical protein
MSRNLWHFLTLVGDVGRDASFELGRFRAIVTDPNERDKPGSFPKFSRFCKRLVSTRFEPAVLDYCCHLTNGGSGCFEIREVGGKDFRLNAVCDLSWSATVFSNHEAERILQKAQKEIGGRVPEHGRFQRPFTDEILLFAFAEALRWKVPFAVFVVTENVGPTVHDTEAIDSSKATLDELVNRAAENALYLPSTQRGFREPENS